jgi:hypothetical protein
LPSCENDKIKLTENIRNFEQDYRALVEYAQLGRICTGLLHSDLDKVKDLSSHNQILLEQPIRANILKMRYTFLEQVFNNCTSVPISEYWFERVSTSSSHTMQLTSLNNMMLLCQ